MTPRGVQLLGIVVAGLAAAGCGGSLGSPDPADGRLPADGRVPDGRIFDGRIFDGPGAGDARAAVSYSTQFDLAESPVSEGGAWTHAGLDWTRVETAGGIAFGTQTGTNGYDDSYAHLSGFPPDQSAAGVIHRASSLDGVCGTHEVEIHLRWSDGPHDAHGYECNLAFDGSYAQIVRWNGPLGDFTYLDSRSVPGGVHSGDTLSATVVGATIRLYVNGAEVASATDDAPFTDGNPGMGFWRGGACGTNGDYGFTSYSATGL